MMKGNKKLKAGKNKNQQGRRMTIDKICKIVYSVTHLHNLPGGIQTKIKWKEVRSRAAECAPPHEKQWERRTVNLTPEINFTLYGNTMKGKAPHDTGKP